MLSRGSLGMLCIECTVIYKREVYETEHGSVLKDMDKGRDDV